MGQGREERKLSGAAQAASKIKHGSVKNNDAFIIGLSANFIFTIIRYYRIIRRINRRAREMTKTKQRINFKDEVPDFIWELCEKNGISKDTFRSRVRTSKMNMFDAATKPLKKKGVPRNYTQEEYELCEKNDIPITTFYSRVKQGWERKHACTLPVDREIVLTAEDRATCRANGIDPKLARKRLDAKWSKEEAITIPPYGRRDINTWTGVARENDIPYSTFYHRIHVLKWTNEQAATIPSNGSNLLTVEQNKIAISNGIKARTIEARIRAGMPIDEVITRPWKKGELKHYAKAVNYNRAG